MISIEVSVSRDDIEGAMVDMNADDLADMIVSVVERYGAPRFTKSLIGMLGDTYTYLEETFSE